MPSFFRHALALALVLALPAGPAAADQIEDALAAALQAYRAGDVATTKQELDLASQLLSQQKAAGLAGFLPPALSGWSREDGETQAMGAAFLGGGLVASARYVRGGDTVEMTLMADNPMVASLAPMFANPALMGAMGQVTRINGQTAVVTQDGDLQTLVGNRVLVQVEGSAARADKEAYLGAVDFSALSAF